MSAGEIDVMETSGGRMTGHGDEQGKGIADQKAMEVGEVVAGH